MKREVYLGDAVYAEFDGYGIKLTAGNGRGGITNTIYLEPGVLYALNKFVESLKEQKTEEPDA